MDYEIDIEEHDVLDNPVIKQLFPDISVIKKEITQYFEEGNFKNIIFKLLKIKSTLYT